MRSNLLYVLLNVTDLILSHQEHSYVVGLGDNSPLWCVVFQNTMANYHCDGKLYSTLIYPAIHNTYYSQSSNQLNIYNVQSLDKLTYRPTNRQFQRYARYILAHFLRLKMQ